VVAVDLTPAMIAEGRREAAGAGLDNIVFEQGRAEKLSYTDKAFDMVMTRLSLHHFIDPLPAVREMVRVCKPGGQVGVMDMISPDDAATAAAYNRLERLRDPSHTRCLTREELYRCLEEAGLKTVQVAVREIEVDLMRWLEMTSTGPEARRIIQDELTQELQGERVTGMRPFMRNDRLMFTQTWVTSMGIK
jgi:ubiquinone/menaquinone biosynthesis C-methylase UbiE